MHEYHALRSPKLTACNEDIPNAIGFKYAPLIVVGYEASISSKIDIAIYNRSLYTKQTIPIEVRIPGAELGDIPVPAGIGRKHNARTKIISVCYDIKQSDLPPLLDAKGSWEVEVDVFVELSILHVDIAFQAHIGSICSIVREAFKLSRFTFAPDPPMCRPAQVFEPYIAKDAITKTLTDPVP